MNDIKNFLINHKKLLSIIILIILVSISSFSLISTLFKSSNKATAVTKEHNIESNKLTPPLKDLTISIGSSYQATDFLNNKEEYTISFKDSKDSTIKEIGNYEISFILCNQKKQCQENKAKLIIKESLSFKVITEEEIINNEEINYGVTKKTTATTAYRLYEDNRKEIISRENTKTIIEYEKFNADYNDIKSEASEVFNKPMSATSRATILEKTNEYRKEKNLKNLKIDKELSLIATIRAIEIAYSNQFSHTRPDGRKWESLIREDMRYRPTESVKLGENLAYGYSTDIIACESLKASKDHYKNMIDDDFNRMGLGKYTFNGKTYWVQLFAS